MTGSKGSTTRGRLRLAEKIVNETRLDGFFAMVVASYRKEKGNKKGKIRYWKSLTITHQALASFNPALS